MALDKSTVLSIANLARIDIPEGDLEGLAHEITQILAWVEQLEAVDTTGVEPMASVTDRLMTWRADAVTDGGDRDGLLRNAPDSRDGFFMVPKVVE